MIKNTPPPKLELLVESVKDWCVETTTVSPEDTVSFFYLVSRRGLGNLFR